MIYYGNYLQIQFQTWNIMLLFNMYFILHLCFTDQLVAWLLVVKASLINICIFAMDKMMCNVEGLAPSARYTVSHFPSALWSILVSLANCFGFLLSILFLAAAGSN